MTDVAVISRDDVLEALRDVYDPEIPVNIVDLGLVYDVAVDDCDVEIKMMFAKPYVGDPWHFAGKKPDEGFRDRLREIKSKQLHKTIDGR